MRMIDVLDAMADGSIKEGTKLLFDGYEYEFTEEHFEDDCGDWIEDVHEIDIRFLNLKAKLLPPKEKKYFIKFNMRGLKEMNYLNYNTADDCVFLNESFNSVSARTHFTKSEMQSIRAVKEFLEDMEGWYRLAEVEDDEND